MRDHRSDSESHGSAVATVFELLGRRWQLRVIWELRTDTLTFRELQERTGGISPGVLSARLTELREAGIVTRDGGYRLTEAGIELLDVYAPISAWTKKWKGPSVS